MHPGKSWRKLLPAKLLVRHPLLATALCVTALLVVAGCVQDGAGEVTPTTSITGSWVYEAGAGCTQHLLAGPDGNWVYQVQLGPDGAGPGEGWLAPTVTGQWQGEGRAAATPGAPFYVTPGRASPPARLLYCGQWLEAPQVALPFARIALDTGVDPGTLSWRAMPVPGHGRLLVGSDAAYHDRFALHLDGTGMLHGLLMSGAGGAPLHHRPPQRLTSNAPPQLIQPFLHLPEQFYSLESATHTTGQVLGKLLLRINTASDVRFGAAPGSSAPACAFALYLEPDFVTPANPNPLAAANLVKPLALNPGDGVYSFLDTTVPVDGGSEPAHLWPVAVVAPSAAPCSANIRARPIVARLLDEHLTLAPPDAPLRLNVGPGQALIPFAHPAVPGRWMGLALNGHGALPRGMRLHDRLFKPARARPGAAGTLQDILGLYAPGTVASYPTLDGEGAQARLHLYADSGAAYGLGPFLPDSPPEPFSGITPPIAAAQSFAPGETLRHYRLTLPAQARLALFSSGGLDTAATLLDGQGIVLAADAQGAADGAGFHIVRTLPAGRYTLSVLREDLNGDFTLNILPEPSGVLGDERLEGCLIAAGALRTTVAEVRALSCAGLGVTSAAGISTYANLTRLDLSGNELSDLTPLAGLNWLHTLALGHNPLTSLAGLASLPSLRRLLLADSALDATLISQLAALGHRLTRLELFGATGLSEAEALLLKQSLQNTTLVTPAGTVLE